MKSFKKKQREDESNFDNFPAIEGIMVSKMIFDRNVKPGFMYRDKRIQPVDSGWRIFAGFESEEYMDNPDNAAFYNPGTILKIDSSLESILLKGIGSVYERLEDGSEWYKVSDFEMETDYMVTHQLTNGWIIEINNLFERRVEENGNLLYTTGDKSVKLIIWNQNEKSKEAIYNDHKLYIDNRDQTLEKTLDIYDFSDEKVLRVGYLIQEQDEDKSYNVMYGSSIIDNQVLEAALYFDDLEDLNWAIKTWKNIKIKY